MHLRQDPFFELNSLNPTLRVLQLPERPPPMTAIVFSLKTIAMLVNDQYFWMKHEPRAFGYKKGKFTEGCLCLFSVSDLLDSYPPQITIKEYPRLPANYAAISHVWKASEAATTAAKKKAKIKISIPTSEDLMAVLEAVSWLGLTQVAIAARDRGCLYLWLDLLCIAQDNQEDKNEQIKKMGLIYKDAEAVLVMFGGCLAVQKVECHSEWINHAWTLQESTLNKKTWALIDIKEFKHYWVQDTFVIGETKIRHLRNGLGLIELKALLDVGTSLGSISVPDKTITPWAHNGEIRCLGDNRCAIEIMQVIIHHIGCESRYDQAMVRSAAWSSICMRMSTKPVDMVYSSMHLFGVELLMEEGKLLSELLKDVVKKNLDPPFWLTLNPGADVLEETGLIPEPNFRCNVVPEEQEEKPPLPLKECVLTCTDICVKFRRGLFTLCGTLLGVTGYKNPFLKFNKSIESQCDIYGERGEIAMIAG